MLSVIFGQAVIVGKKRLFCKTGVVSYFIAAGIYGACCSVTTLRCMDFCIHHLTTRTECNIIKMVIIFETAGGNVK